MTGRRPAPARADKLANIGEWIRQQKASAAQLGHDAELAGQAAWDRVIGGGPAQAAAGASRRLAARGPGSAAPTGKARPLSSAPRPAPARAQTSIRAALHAAADQTLAGARGAQDALTLGLGDRVYAGGAAMADALHGADLGQAWQSRMAAERARDQYDAKHYRAARTAGEIAGTGVGLLAFGPARGALAGGVRIAEASPMIAREAAALGGLGAGAGVASQGVTDLGRRRLGSAGDYGGSALGGAITALASVRAAPGQAAALGGATTSAAQDLLNGRSIDARRAGQAALASRYLAGPLGAAGSAYSEGLHFTDKGKLGEALGRMRTRLNGEAPLAAGRVKVNGGPKYTVPDHVTAGGLMTEQKFGPSARLSGNQKAAYNEFGDRYRVDHFLPRDVGAIIAYPFGLAGRFLPSARDQ